MCLFATHYFELTELASRFKPIANVHLDAVEHDGRIVFMHQIKQGAANKSYGIQVAELAGLPQTALQSARETLAALENNQKTVLKDNLAETPAAQNKAMPATTPQLELFNDHSAVQNYVTKLDLDEISPREALQHLYELSALISSSK